MQQTLFDKYGGVPSDSRIDLARYDRREQLVGETLGDLPRSPMTSGRCRAFETRRPLLIRTAGVD
jgi:hypothetical protein